MSSRPSVDELVVHFRGLRISVSESAAASGPDSPDPSPTGSFTLVEAPTSSSQAVSGPLAREAPPLPEELSAPSAAEDLLEATSPAELEGLRLGPFCRLGRGLGVVGSWTQRARIARAYRAGLSAGARLRGERDWIVSSPALSLRNRIYIVLRCDSQPEGFVTERFSTFELYVRRDRQGRLEPWCICHGFASRSEAEAYLGGAEPLPLVYLVDDDSSPRTRITAFLLKHRAGGFMIALPHTTQVHDLISGFSTEAGDNPLGFTEVDIECETPRRRPVGQVSLIFVDVPWDWLGYFRKGSTLRSSTLALVSIQSGGAVVRPVASAALTAADAWITAAAAEPDLQESMAEYATAAEGAEEPEEPEADEEDEGGHVAELAKLRAQVAALERAAQSNPLPLGGQARGSVGAGRRGARDLFPEAGGIGLSNADLDQLRAAAGAAPPRIAQHERAPREAGAAQADGLLAELDAEAAQDELAVTGADPLLQRLLIIQTRMLGQLAASKPQGPLESALASAGGKEAGNLNARGSAARDAFVKILKDHSQVASQIRRLVAEDVGESVEDPPHSLMRRYIERRCPLGDHRTLGLIGTFAAQAWQASRESGNLELEAWMARLILFVDQAGTESGKTQLAWLLTGLPEPSWSTMMREKLPFPVGFGQLSLPSGDGLACDSNERGPGEHEGSGEGRRARRGRCSSRPPTEKATSAEGRRSGLHSVMPRDGSACPAAGVELLQPDDNSTAFSFDPAGAKPSAARAGRDVLYQLGDLWPVPMPARARWTAQSFCSLGPHRRRRARVHQLAWDLVRLQVGCLNWLALGCPNVPPSSACARGAPVTESQHSVVDTLERHSLHFLRAGRFSASSLGRSAEKFDLLLRMVLELPQCDTRCPVDVDRMLTQFVSALHADWDSYSRPRAPNAPQTSASSQAAASEEAGGGAPESGALGSCALGPGLSSKKVIADRIKWTLPPSFDPRPFLSDPAARMLYDDPNAFRLPASAWPRLPRAQVHCSRNELLKLAAKWDEHQALRLVPCDQVPFHETVGCFSVSKDSACDRFILNPVVANSRTHGLSHFTKLLAPGALLALAHLPSDRHMLRFNCDDLSEMYYTFLVSSKRAERNSLGIPFSPWELQHFSVFDSKLHNKPCYVALGALAMGDCHAVEFAQQSHFNVLSTLACSMRPYEYAAYRRPYPRSACTELLAIDDHLTAQLCTREEHRLGRALRDTAIFNGAERAYPSVGLVQHPRKRQRNVVAGTFLGADIDGLAGLVSAPRHRIGVLMRITCTVARKGCCSADLLSSLLGLWIHVLLFRRPALAILQAVFSDARREPRTSVFQLQRESINELFALCALAPLLQADLRVDYPGLLFCMDASPTGAGLCSAVLPSATVKELWRFSEQKGFYTKLLEPAGAILASSGLDDDPGVSFASALGPATASGFAFGSEPLPLRPAVLKTAGCLHLFGTDPGWRDAHLAAGLQDVPLLDFGLSEQLCFADLASDAVFHNLRALLTEGVFFDLHVTAPAHTYMPGAAGLEVASSAARLARRLCFLLCLAVSSGVYFSVEQPLESRLFRFHCFRNLVGLGAVLSYVCTCDFGAPFKRSVALLHNKPWLVGLGRSPGVCHCPASSLHFPAFGVFSSASLQEFEARCTPSALAVFGESPAVGDSVELFCSRLPCALHFRAASGSALATQGYVAPVPASLSLDTLRDLGFSGLGPDFLPSDCTGFEPRPFHDDPEWIGELADCLEFVELLRYKFAAPGHINILECRAYKTWIKWCAKRHRGCRLLGLIDSRVLLGAAAKGRSASAAVCRVLRSTLPYVLGSSLYPGGLHVYSAKNRADGPSRGSRPLAPSKAWPSWLTSLVSGDTRPFDLVCAAAAVPRRLGRWVRLFLLLAGDVERNPGPRHSGAPRGSLDLEAGFAASTRHKMAKALSAFTAWLLAEFGLPLVAVTSSASTVALALRAFGLHLYAGGHPRYLLVYAITSIQDRFPEFRSHLSPAWQVDRKWQLAEPGECRPVISQPILQAAIGLAICWGWYDWAAVTAVGFLCMLHPAEMIPLVRQDLVFPADALTRDPVAYVHIRNPKTQRFARRQHSRLEDPLVLEWLHAMYFDLPLHARLFRGSMHVYRRQWNAVMSRLGVPHQLAQRGATPGVLRGSGATFLYLETEDLPLVAWRGRWSKTKTVEFYLQEVAAQLLLHRFTSKQNASRPGDFASAGEKGNLLGLCSASASLRFTSKQNASRPGDFASAGEKGSAEANSVSVGGWSDGSCYEKIQLNYLEEELEKSKSKMQRDELWKTIMANKKELKQLYLDLGKGKSPPQPAKGKAAAKAATRDPPGSFADQPAQGSDPTASDDDTCNEPQPEQGQKDNDDDKPEEGKTRVKEEPDYN
ncbi:unnamed protein product [Symbiodinium sp. CCMP2592]|nr:unnamed protein product [Symbiodinium sp. CCMP2592]